MTMPVPTASSIRETRRGALTPWRRLQSALAAAIVVVGALWLVLILGPWGPLAVNVLTPILVLIFLVWVGVDAVVRELTKRARRHDPQ